MMVQQTEMMGNQGLLCLSGRMKKREQTQENISKDSSTNPFQP